MSEAISEQQFEAIKRAVHQASLPLLALVPDLSKGGGFHVKCAVGTGVMIEIEDRLFLLTARHVVEAYPADKLWFPPSPGANLETFGTVSTFYDQTNPGRDTVVVELHDTGLADKIRSAGYWKILTIENIAASKSYDRSGTRLLSGYPSELGYENQVGFAQTPLVLSTKVLEPDPTPSSISVPCPDTDMFFVFDNELEDTATSEIVVPPKLQGMSGCGIWLLLPRTETDLWEPWQSLYLIGTQRSVLPRHWIRGVSWRAIADILQSNDVGLSNGEAVPS